MPRLTITLSEETHRALKETAVRQGRSIAELIEESLRFRGYRTLETAEQLVSQARRQAALSEEEALKLAIEETQAQRRGR
jgi:predicted CopG family antitoxin